MPSPGPPVERENLTGITIDLSGDCAFVPSCVRRNCKPRLLCLSDSACVPHAVLVLVMAERVGAAAVETGEEGGRDLDDLQPECSKKRKLVYSGAAKYQSKFKIP